jgi:L-alanine-DL-glutamate epimerase-like enolase superfamily enzyme
MAGARVTITSIGPFALKGARGHPAWTWARVRTDQGIEGAGEGFSRGWGSLERLKRILDHTRELNERLRAAVQP